MPQPHQGTGRMCEMSVWLVEETACAQSQYRTGAGEVWSQVSHKHADKVPSHKLLSLKLLAPSKRHGTFQEAAPKQELSSTG